MHRNRASGATHRNRATVPRTRWGDLRGRHEAREHRLGPDLGELDDQLAVAAFARGVDHAAGAELDVGDAGAGAEAVGARLRGVAIAVEIEARLVVVPGALVVLVDRALRLRDL